LADRGTAGDVISDFTKGTGGDGLDLHDLLSSIGAPHTTSAFGSGYLQFLQSGSNALVQVDSDGGGNSYVTLATLTNQVLTQADSQNYVL